MKAIVHTSKPNTLEDLKAKITNLNSSELQNRISLCTADDGGYIGNK